MENVLIVDIDSGSTGAALLRTHPESVPEVVYRVRTLFSVSGEPAKEPLEAAMLASLRATLTSIAGNASKLQDKKRGTALNKVLVAFSSPWLTSHLKTVIIEREKGFVLDHAMLKGIMKEEKELFTSKLKEDFKEEVDVFESVVTSLYLNGYETSDLAHEKVTKAEASFLHSAASAELIWKVENEIIKAVGVKRGLVLSSFMYSFYKVLSHAFQSLHSALLINMASEITDILFLRHGSSALSASLPFGPASVARAVAEKLGIPQKLAESYLSIFASGAFDEETTKAIDDALIEVESRWSALWKSMGESIPEGASVPYSVFLVAPTGFEKLMKTFLASALGGRSIILLGETNAFTKELVKADPALLGDEKILVLSSFSNLVK